MDICWHYTSTGRGLISGASPTQGSRDIPLARTLHNAPPTSRFDKLPAANPYASQIDAIARNSTNGSLEHYLDASRKTTFLVIHDDELLYEKHFDSYDKNSIQTSFSMAKSFVSALVGIAIDEGHIKRVDEPIKPTKYSSCARKTSGLGPSPSGTS